MNPDTQLTTEQIQLICARHDITYHSHARVNTGFSHEVHRLNDDLIIKLYNTSKPKNFETELALLKSAIDFPKPKLIASHAATNKQDRSYIIMSYIAGFSLGSKWHLATNEQREQLIKNISKTLQSINQLDLHKFIDTTDSWDIVVEKRIHKLVNKLRAKNVLNETQISKVLATLAANKQYLANSQLYPVYWDIHFDNFIVNKQFELQAVVDLENVELTPLDYPLFVVQKLTDEPQKYLSEDYEKYANTKDYANLKYWYKKYYPQIFAFDNLNERVNLYLLVDTLHLLLDWPNVKELYKKLEILTQK